MTPKPTRTVSIILERIAVQSRWEDHKWQVAGVVADAGGEVRDIVQHEDRLQRLHPGLVLTLYRDEAEGYFLNVSSDDPSVFVSLRLDEATGEPYPFQGTLSYNEAARWMDSAERVERASLGPELVEWVGTWVEENYRPEAKKRRKPRSFDSPEGRLRDRR